VGRARSKGFAKLCGAVIYGLASQNTVLARIQFLFIIVSSSTDEKDHHCFLRRRCWDPRFGRRGFRFFAALDTFDFGTLPRAIGKIGEAWRMNFMTIKGREEVFVEMV